MRRGHLARAGARAHAPRGGGRGRRRAARPPAAQGDGPAGEPPLLAAASPPAHPPTATNPPYPQIEETKQDGTRLVGTLHEALALRDQAEAVAATHLADVEALSAEVQDLRAQHAELPELLRAAEDAALKAVSLERSLGGVRQQLDATRADLDAARAELGREQAASARLQAALRLASDTVRLREQEADALNDTARDVLFVETGSPVAAPGGYSGGDGGAAASVRIASASRRSAEAEADRLAARERSLVAELAAARDAARAAEARADAANTQVAAPLAPVPRGVRA